MVGDYIQRYGLKVPQFINGKPGRNWLHAFMQQNKLSMKKAEMISVARKSATANRFVIYDFYVQLAEIVTTQKLTAAKIWNCDESGFPNDPLKCRVVSVKGQTAYKVTCGARRENITTLAVCSAAGKVLDPLIIFPGKYMQSNWKGEKALPKTFIGVSDSGWMTTEVFAIWFEKFADEIKERPLLLIFDGHLTHISLTVIEKASDENITILKLPPHVTDVLQPLDVACFGPLKRLWESHEFLGKRIWA